jgi:hypothetical protein
VLDEPIVVRGGRTAKDDVARSRSAHAAAMSEVLLYVASGDRALVASVGDRLAGGARHYIGVERSGEDPPDGRPRERPTGEHLVLYRGDEPSPAEWSAGARPGEVRRVYGRRQAWTTDGHDDAELGSPYIMATWWSVRDDGRAQFEEWYEQEHIPLLLRVPGRSAITHYARLAGDGQLNFAIHELDSPEVLDHPLDRQAASTPWRERAVVARSGFERRLYRAVAWPPTAERR